MRLTYHNHTVNSVKSVVLQFPLVKIGVEIIRPVQFGLAKEL